MCNIKFIHDQSLKTISILKDVMNQTNELDDIINDYELYIEDLYNDYINSNNKKTMKLYIEEMNKFSIIRRINFWAQKYGVRFNVKLPNIYIPNENICSCDGKVVLSETTNNLICLECGEVKRSIDVIDDKIIKGNGRSSSLKNNYKHKPYSKKVLKQFLGLEDFKFDKKLLEFFKKKLDQYKPESQRVGNWVKCSWFRNILKSKRKSNLYKHITALKYQTTGLSPPKLTYEEELEFDILYTIYQEKYNQIRENNKSFLRCEYIFYKLFSQVIKNEEKKNDILSYIPLPDRNTLINLDIKYKKMCDLSDGLLHYCYTLPNYNY